MAKAGNFYIPPPHFHSNIKFPHIETARDWNNLPPHLKNIRKLKEFKNKLLDHFLDKYEVDCLLNNCYICK